MFTIKRLDKDLCTEFNASAILALHGNNKCDINTIKTTCFASETCLYGSTGPDLNVLLYCDYTYIITNNGDFCGCIAADGCNGNIPNFSKIPCLKDALYIHTLCVEEKYRKNGLATQLLDTMKQKNRQLFLTVATGKGGMRKDLSEFFEHRSSNLLKFYKKQGFKNVDSTEKYILLSY